MGFMDRAKKLAEQAQQKLDEAQQSFNQSASPQDEPQEGGVRYDEHGRRIQQEEPPAAAAPPPSAEPPPADTAAAADESAAPGETPPTPSGDANQTPDPFKPLK
jgi:hypothetical protein